MPECHFCNTEGLLAPTELHAAPPDVDGGAGLKLVTCDFHQHHCAFFMCGGCWGKQLHLCRNEHPHWFERLNRFDIAPKELERLERWRFRYATEDAAHPSVCSIRLTEGAFCPSCVAYREGNVGERCGACNASLLTSSGCPACLPLRLPDNDGLLQECPVDEDQRREEERSEPVGSAQLVLAKAPDDLAPFRKLDLQYLDETDYQCTSLSTPPTDGRCRRFRVSADIPDWGEEGELSEAVQDPSGWPEYRSTNLALMGAGVANVAGIRVLLPARAFAFGSFPCRHAEASRTIGEGRSTRGSNKKARMTVTPATTRYAGAVVYQPKKGAVFALTDEQLDLLHAPSKTVDEEPLLIELPSRGGGGSGGALGRANDLGSSGVQHALLVRNKNAPDVVWERYARLSQDLRDPKKPGNVELVIDPPLAEDTRFLPLRLIPGSTLELYVDVPERERPPLGREARTVELWRERESDASKRRFAMAQQAFSAAFAVVDDGNRLGALNGMQAMARLEQLGRALEEVRTAALFLDEVREGRSASDGEIRAAASRILSRLRQRGDEALVTEELVNAADEAYRAAPLPQVRAHLDQAADHLKEAHAHHARSFATYPAYTAEDQALLKWIQANLDLKGDPEELFGQPRKDWWGEHWVPPGLDDDWEPPEEEEEVDPPTELVGPETESDRPDAYPDRPPHTDDYWNWNGRPLAVVGDVERTWRRLTDERLAQRRYKDTGLHLMRPHTDSRKDGDREQDTFFDGVSATEVALGLTNKLAGSRFSVLPPDFNAKRPNPWYEWSHLIGDGEGGGIHRSNIVSSTRANNTEMLIIETMLQQAYAPLRKLGLDLVLRVQATTFGRIPELEKEAPFHQQVRHIHFQTHVGDWMRYSVWLRPGPDFQRPEEELEPAPDYPATALVLDHILDCLRPRISKAQVRVMDYQARYLLARTLKARYGLELEALKGLSMPEFGGGDGSSGSLEARPYLAARPLETAQGRRLRRIANDGAGDCLFLAFRDGMLRLPGHESQAAFQRAGFNAVPSAQEIRERAVDHLRRILGYGGDYAPFGGDLDRYGPEGDPRSGHGAMVEFLTTYREDYARLWGGYSDWELYLGLMRQQGRWGDMLMCVALSHLFGLQLDVHRGPDVVQPILANELAQPAVVRLYNPAGVHFEALQEEEQEQEE